MPGIVIVGAQWGDEGKGKVTDLLAEQTQVVVRYQGGNNAGHTVVVDQQTLKLHLIPSGIHRPGVLCVIGNGLAVDPRALVAEMDELEANGLDTSGLRISANAHLVMPYHLMLDGIEEDRRGGKSIGTTRRGIGPTYTDKAADLHETDAAYLQDVRAVYQRLAACETGWHTIDCCQAGELLSIDQIAETLWYTLQAARGTAK